MTQPARSAADQSELPEMSAISFPVASAKSLATLLRAPGRTQRRTPSAAPTTGTGCIPCLPVAPASASEEYAASYTSVLIRTMRLGFSWRLGAARPGVADSTPAGWPGCSRWGQDTAYLLFPAHPGSLRFKKTADRAYYSPSLALAVRWGFDVHEAKSPPRSGGYTNAGAVVVVDSAAMPIMTS